jgi:uncharacterized protein (TIGR00255 family)
MTGAGAAAIDDAALGRFEAEVRSVNHRFLKTTVRTLGPLPALEGAVEDLLRGAVERGHLTIAVRYAPTPAAAARVDEVAFGAAAKRLKSLAAAHGLPAPTVQDCLSLPGVVAASADATAAAALTERALASVRAALDRATASREREGEALRREMGRLLAEMSSHASAVAAGADRFPAAVKARIEDRVAALVGPSVPLDPAALAREAALLAERADAREEIARLEAHIEHARELLAAGGAVGRRLDFLAQEMNREANTVGSKCDDLEVTRSVLELKAGVERFREQAQNLE